MDMELVAVESGAGPTTGYFCLRGTCPYPDCRTVATFPAVTNAFVDDPYSVVGRRMVCGLRCEACHKYILGIIATDAFAKWTYEAHYPLDSPDDSVSDLVPDAIKEDFQEALRCIWIKSFKATVLMCRRALQVSCDLEKAEGNDLFKQIDDLASKQRITAPLKKMAHRIRLLGKKGAHGDYSDIDETITEKDATDAIKFMHHYLDHVYILAAALDEPDAS